MKSILIFLVASLLSQLIFAQQTTKSDDALLLDYYQNQRFADAVTYLRKTYPEPVTDLKALGSLAYASQMAGNLPDAEGYYQRVYDTDTTNTAVLFNLGAINIRRSNYLKAEVFYKKIISKDTTSFMSYKQMAKICFEKGEQLNMIKYLTKANTINPAEPDVASDLCDALINFKNLDEAAKVLNKAIAVDGENVELLMSLLKLTSSQDKFNDEKNTCLTLIKLGAGSGYVLTKLGTAYYNLKEYECSAATLADINEQEQGETSYYIAGLAYKALMDYPKSVENLAKAVEVGISPNIASYYGEIADANEKQTKLKKAALAYQKALQFKEDPIIYYLLANLYDTKLKDKKDAVVYYKKYLALKSAEKKQAYIAYAKSRVEELGR